MRQMMSTCFDTKFDYPVIIINQDLQENNLKY